MPFHFCPDELLLVLTAVPFLGSAAHWLRHKLRGDKTGKEVGPCHLNKCTHGVIKERTDHDG